MTGLCEGAGVFDGAISGAAAGERTQALLKAQELEVVRLVLRKGRRLPRHAAPGEITLLGLEGRMDLLLDDGVVPLLPGRLVHLAAGAPHAVRAAEDSAALLTISLLTRRP